jgi:putative acetyltransferase
MTYTIQKASPTNYPEITKLWEASVRATHHFLSELHIQFYKNRIPNDYLPALDVFCIKTDDDKIAGFIGLSDDKIEMLFVDPEFFGCGIGSALTNFAINEKGISRVDVNEQNPLALKFYNSLGFKETGRSDLDGEGNAFPILSLEL